jgi:hypothetical protein
MSCCGNMRNTMISAGHVFSCASPAWRCIPKILRIVRAC